MSREEDDPELPDEQYHYIKIQVTATELKLLKACFNASDFDVKVIIQPDIGYDVVYAYLLRAIVNAAYYRSN